MAGEQRLAARLSELIAPPAGTIGPWRDQWRAHLGAHAARICGGWIPWRWPRGVSRGDGRGPASFRLLRDRPWQAAFETEVEHLLKIQLLENVELASLLLPRRLIDWASIRPDRRAWALRIDLVGERFHWGFALYDQRSQYLFGRRWLEPASGRAYHDLLWRDPNAGRIEFLVESLLVTVLPVYDRLGIRRIELIASLAAGGALWPAFGAVPKDDSSWRRLAQDIRRRLRREPPEVRAEVGDRIEGHLAAASPDAVLDILKETSTFDDREKLPLGKRLLGGRRYDAVIKLDHPSTRKILEDRISRAYDSQVE